MPDEPIGSVTAYAGEVVDTGRVIEVPQAGSGWLLCNGAALSSQQFQPLFAAIGAAHGNGSDDPNPATDFNLPDFRGYFLRGVSGPTDRDPNRGDAERPANHLGGNIGNRVGSTQGQQVVNHSHTIDGFHLEAEGGSGFDGAGMDTNSNRNHPMTRAYSTSSVGGSETRPKNVYVHWIIKARN